MARQLIPLFQIQAVGVVALVAAVEMHGYLSGILCQLMNIIQQQAGVTFATVVGQRAQVIDINDLSAV